MSAVTVNIAWRPQVSVKTRVVSFILETPWEHLEQTQGAEWPLNPQSFRTAGRSAEARISAPRCFSGVELWLVESLTPRPKCL